MPWSTPFDEPIALPNGKMLVTLKDAGNYIAKLQKAEHDAPEWQAAMEALILVATRGSWKSRGSAEEPQDSVPTLAEVGIGTNACP